MTQSLTETELQEFEAAIGVLEDAGRTHIPMPIVLVRRLIADERARNYATRNLPPRPGVKRAAA